MVTFLSSYPQFINSLIAIGFPLVRFVSFFLSISAADQLTPLNQITLDATPSLTVPQGGFQWTGKRHKYDDPTVFCDAIKALTPPDSKRVHAANETDVYRKIRYWYPSPENANWIHFRVRDSIGYQLWSSRYERFFWSQMYFPKYDFDWNLTDSKPGFEILEQGWGTPNFFLDIALLPTPTPNSNKSVNECLSFGSPPWVSLPQPFDIYNPSVSTYCGIETLPAGFMAKATTFDVSVVRDRWVEETPLVYYFDRSNGSQWQGQNYF